MSQAMIEQTPADASFMHRYLDPATSLAEILFGLIMTLTFTLSAGLLVADEGREGARQLLIAVIGCNVAWGIIDAMLYLMGQLFDRGRLRRLGRAIRASSSGARASGLVAGELEPLLDEILPTAEREALYARIATHVAQRPERLTRITGNDWLGALLSFVLVVITSIPAAIPFLLIDQAQVALRVSNLILLALLFVVGASWARYTVSRPWIVGTVMLVIGTALVLAAISLGG